MSGWRRERGVVSLPLPLYYWVASPRARWLFVMSRQRQSKRGAGPAFPALLSDRRKLQR